MGIEWIEVYRTVLNYHEPFRISAGVTTKSRNVIVKMFTDYGVIGWGESSPSKRVTGENPETIVKVLDEIAPHLIGMCPLRIEQIIDAMDKWVVGNPSAKAAVDLALHDILGKTVRKPLFRLMGGFREEVLTDLTLGIKTPREMAKDASKAVKKGFRALKVKVGVNPKEDMERVKMIRETIGPDIAIRIDANQGWTPTQAIKVLNKLERFNVEFAEQPVQAEDVEGLARVKKKSRIPVMADESVHSPEDAMQLIRREAVDLINIKLMKSGGIWKARKIAAVAEAAGVPCMIGCMGESNLGISAATHLAAAVKNIKYADLDSDLLIKDKLVLRGGTQLEASKRTPTERPGLGVTKIDEKLLGKPLKVYK